VNRRQLAASAGAALLLLNGANALAATPPSSWDNLVLVNSERLNYVYLLPGADFRTYTKVMLDPTQIAFKKDWQKDYNSTKRALGSRVSDADVENAITEGGKAASAIFSQAFADGGYQIVTEPGPDVLRIRTAVVNLQVTSPDTGTAGATYSGSAGAATLVVEAMDSVSGAILGRAVDSRVAGDNSYMMNRTSATNRSDFRAVATAWAKSSVDGLNELKKMSPISPTGSGS
jgi:hypothetical protein